MPVRHASVKGYVYKFLLRVLDKAFGARAEGREERESSRSFSSNPTNWRASSMI